MSPSQENKQTARAAVKALLGAHNPAVLAGIYAPGVIDHSSPSSPAGRDALRATASLLCDAAAGLSICVEAQIAEADKVATRWSATGSDATGLAGDVRKVRDVFVMRVSRGQVVEQWTSTGARRLARRLRNLRSQEK